MSHNSFCAGFPLGPNWGPTGAQLGPNWGPTGAQLGPNWGPTGAQLGPNWGPTGAQLGPNWGPTGAQLGPNWGPTGAQLGPNWGQLGTQPSHKHVDVDQNLNIILFIAVHVAQTTSSSLTIYTIQYTVNVDIFALYIFSRNSRFLNIRENMYTSKITFMIP